MYIGNGFGIKPFNPPTQNRRIGHQACPIHFGMNKLERSPLNGDEVSFSDQKQEPEVFYELGWIDRIIFPEPTSLKGVSEFLLKPENKTKFVCFCISEINAMKDSKFADTKITELLGNGTTACAFLMEDGNVLKITNDDHFDGREHEDFDVPVYEEGNIENKYLHNLHYYIEQYANPEDVSDEEIKDIVKRIRDKGYGTYDICPCQFGKTSDGNVYLLDPECAYKKSDY